MKHGYVAIHDQNKEGSIMEANLQSNGIIERIHQVVGNSLRTFELESATLNEDNPWTPYLALVAWAVCSTYHTILNATPGQLIFGRDMVLPIQSKQIGHILNCVSRSPSTKAMCRKIQKE